MKVTFEFNTENPDEYQELQVFQRSREMNSLIWEFSHNVEHRVERESCNSSNEYGYNKAMTDWFKMMSEYGISTE